MQPFKDHTGLVVPLDRIDVDTDQMVPKQFILRGTREGYGRDLFHDWRYLPMASLTLFCVQLSALSGRVDSAGARKFRLRIKSRTCCLGG